MAEGRHVFGAKSRVKVWEWAMWLADSSGCACDSDQLVNTWLQATESKAESKEKGNVLILVIPIPSSLRLRFLLPFLIHTGKEGSMRFRFSFRRHCEPALNGEKKRDLAPLPWKVENVIPGSKCIPTNVIGKISAHIDTSLHNWHSCSLQILQILGLCFF